MKKIIALALALTLALAMTACGKTNVENTDPAANVTAPTEDETAATTTAPDSDIVPDDAAGEVLDGTGEDTGVVEVSAMTYAEYAAAELDAPVSVLFTVQATQSWWDNKITVYGADKDGGYFVYNMVCSQEDAEKLVPGATILVNGFKTAWAGEVEINADATFEFVDAESYISSPVDATALLGTDELIDLQNQKVLFTDMTVSAVSYKNGEPGDDIYVNFTKDDAEYYFCLEYYLNGSDEEFYNMVGNLEVGQVCDVEGFLYWYEGANPHITKVTLK